MTDETVTNAQVYSTTTTTNRGLERRSVYIDEQNNNLNKSSRKFRWSSCFSFISSKFKKSKSQKIPAAAYDIDELEHDKYVVSTENKVAVGPIDDAAVVVKATGASWKHQQQHQHHHHQPTSSLSPPPRQTKNKRDSSLSQLQTKNDNGNASSKDRRPLVDPTLTPRVKPRSIKSKKQPSLLRLSLDAELLQQQSPDGIFYDNDSSTTSTCKTGHSSFTFTPTSATQYPPFRSGTLGAVKNNNGKPRLSTSTNESDIPPLPLPRINIASGFDNKSSSRPDSQSTTHTNISFVTDSPSSISAIDGMIPNVDEEEKLTLKERRQRRSPLSMPDTNQLTLALNGLISETDLDHLQPTEAKPVQAHEPHVDISYGEDEDHMWRQQLLEQTIAFSLQNKSRQDAMLTLEGKKARGYQPVVTVRQLNGHYDDDDNETITTAHINGDLVKDKAQYDAIVSRTHKRQLSSSHEDGNYNNNNSNIYRTSSLVESSTNKKKEPAPTTSNHLDIITENEIAHNVTTTANKMVLLSPAHGHVAPETPSPLQQNAPSLISAPSTPNSIDSSVLEDDYLNDRLHNLAAFIHPSS